MVTKLNTAVAPAPGTKSGSGNGLLILAGLALVGWAVYELFIKEEKKEEPKKEQTAEEKK